MRRTAAPWAVLCVLLGLTGSALGAVEAQSQRLNAETADFSKEAFLKRYGNEYGYDGRIDDIYAKEVGPRLNGSHYMDFTGAALYWTSQAEAAAQDLATHTFGNPHSINPPSLLTDERIAAVRARLLALFGVDESTHELVLTRSGTGALNLLADAFPWSPASTYAYTRANHNSVLGIRSTARQHGAQHGAVSEAGVEAWLADTSAAAAPPLLPGGERHVASRRAAACAAAHPDAPTYSLFAYPARDNYDGVLYPLRWVEGVHAKSTPRERWFVLLDAAAYAPTSPLNLTATPADFVALSFYKLFGLPTGVGALIARKPAADLLRKSYWGGGAVFLATAALDWHHYKLGHESLEDGTLPFLDIVALQYGLDAFERLGGPHAIKAHTSALGAYAYDRLSALAHSNAAPLLHVFGKHASPDRAEVQGATINFQLLSPSGALHSYRNAGKALADAGLFTRLGCTCNPGACYAALGLRDVEIRDFAATKHDNWTDWEWIPVRRPVGPGGAEERVYLPLGSIRVSLGAMSRWEDIDALARFLTSTYIDKEPSPMDQTPRAPAIDYC